MSSPNHPTSDIEDAFSSNFLNYIPASPDYVPASPGKTYSSSSNNLIWRVPKAVKGPLLYKNNHNRHIIRVIHSAPKNFYKESGENVNSKSYAHVVNAGPHQFHKKEDSPAIVLDETYANKTDYSLALLGKVKDFTSLTNLNVVLANEGFVNVKLKYMGGFWMMIVFTSEVKSFGYGLRSFWLDASFEERHRQVEKSDLKRWPTIFEKEQASVEVKEGCNSIQNETRSEDLFNIYDLLDKKKSAYCDIPNSEDT
ncbi:hypothetical protein Tco_0992674 [Tanacetum coccineum]|uniref:YTH domain-containing protein n=1 Tax=Tanacetum coccineum TaxID=301880 RepID=A0ABQ5F351_9ASTR